MEAPSTGTIFQLSSEALRASKSMSKLIGEMSSVLDTSSIYKHVQEPKVFSGLRESIAQRILQDGQNIRSDAERAHERLVLELGQKDISTIVVALENSDLPYRQVKNILEKIKLATLRS